MRAQIYTIVDAARELGVAPIVVSTLVRGHQIPTQPVPHNGKAKGLTRADLARLRKILGPTASHKASVTSSTH